MFRITNASFTKLHLRSMPLLSLQQTKRRSCVLMMKLIRRGRTNISGSRWPGGNRNDEILETFGSFPSLCPLLHFKHQYINFSLYDEILDAFGSFPNLCSLLDLKQQFKADMFNQFPIYLQ